MACSIERHKNGRIKSVKAPNGKASNLYESILNNMPKAIELDNYTKEAFNRGMIKSLTRPEIALSLWSKTHTFSFNHFNKNLPKDENGEFVYSDNLKLFSEGEFGVDEKSIYQLTDKEVGKPAAELEKILVDTLSTLGVDIQLVDKIRDRNGNVMNSLGKAELYNQVIQLTENRNANTLAEETAHMITAMLGPDHPLMKQMMNQIDNYIIYDYVKQKYKNILETEEDFRFEAVGKLIAEHIIKKVPFDSQSKKEYAMNWWQRLISVLKQKLFNKNNAKLNEAMTAFEKVAEAIINNEVANIVDISETKSKKNTLEVAKSFNMNTSGFMPSTVYKAEVEKALKSKGIRNIEVARASNNSYYFKRNGRKINPFDESFQLEESSQENIVKKLVEDRKKVSDKKALDAEGRERYVFESKIVANRVTDLQQSLFNRGKTKEDIEKIQNSPKSLVGKEMGTRLHDINETLLNFAIPQRDNLQLPPGVAKPELPKLPRYMKSGHLVEMGKSINYLADEINEQQRKIDPDGKATVITENFVFDPKKDIAGSQDVLVIYSDGSASIYDYKFINFTKEKINGKWMVAPDTMIPFIKEKSFNLQIPEYKRILKEVYGIKKFRATRILPFNIQYKYDNKTKQPIAEVADLEGFKVNTDKEYLIPLPVAQEITKIPQLDNILKVLFKKEESLVKELQDNWSNNQVAQRLKLELGKVKKSIKHIQVSYDITPLIESVNLTLDTIGRSTSSLDINSIGDLNKMIAEVRLFDSIYKDIRSYSSEEDNEKMVKISKRLADAEVVLNEKLVELLSEYSPDINTPQKELSFLKRNMGYMSQINHPIFEVAWDLIKESTGRTNKEVKQFAEDIEPKVKALEAWAKSKGITLLDAYRKITNQKTGNLIGMYSSEFHKSVKENRDSGNTKWFKDNYKITEEGEKKYKADLAAYEKSLEGLGDKYKQYRLESWKNTHDLSRDSAWLNSYALNVYAELKKPESFYSDAYKELLNPANKALKDYYEFYRQANINFNKMVDEKIDGNFVANIQKDLVDSIAQGSGIIHSIKNAKDDFLNGMRVRQNEMMMSIGESETKIPLLYYDNFMYKDKDGQWVKGTDKKNEDLTNNIILFSEAVYRKKNMSDIKDTIESLKLQINNQQVILSDNYGKPQKNKLTGEFELSNSSKNAEVYDALTKALVYGKRLQNKDSYITIGDNVYSVNKILSNVMSYMSTKSLAFNYVSGFGNLMAGYANSYIKSVGGRYYNSKQMWKAHKMLASRSDGDLYNHLTSFWNIEKDHWVKEEAAKLSASKLTKNLTFDKWYILQQKGDEFVANTILVSMMQNYGLDENGNVKRLALLPEGTKSLLERVDRSNDKIAIDGLTDEGFNQFRNMVKYVSRQVKGTNTSEDISMIQTHIWGKSIMHFRNWIAPMVKERFGSLEYTKDVQEYEYGRYKSLWNSITKEKFLPTLKRLMLDVVTFGRYKYKGDIEVFKQQYHRFIEENPNFTEENFPIEEYISLRERTIREAMHEIKIISALAIMIVAARSDWDDDGKPEYKDTKVSRELFKLFNRAYLEMSFFSAPQSVNDLLKSPVPLLQVGIDFTNFVSNTGDEIGDILIPDNVEDATPLGHYSKKMFPITKHVFDFMEDFNEDED